MVQRMMRCSILEALYLALEQQKMTVTKGAYQGVNVQTTKARNILESTYLACFATCKYIFHNIAAVILQQA